MNTEKIWNNLGRYFSDELSETERIEMEKCMASDPELQEAVSQLKILWRAKSSQRQGDVGQAWKNMKMELDKQHEEMDTQPAKIYWLKRSWVQYGAIAAGIAAILLIALFLFSNFFKWNSSVPFKRDKPRIEYVTLKGQREQRILPDGTKVYLNADSKVIIPEGFLKTNRFVYLQGEAYFEVSDYKNLPFEVYASGIITMVKHKAAFNVRSFPEQKDVILSVKRGQPYITKVKATSAEALKLPMMKIRPAHKIRSSEAIAFNKKTDVFETVKEKNEKEYFGWRKGILYFDDSDPKALVKKIERWYGINIKYNVCIFKHNQKFSGEFHKPKLKEVLARIGMDMDVIYSIDGANIFLKGKC